MRKTRWHQQLVVAAHAGDDHASTMLDAMRPAIRYGKALRFRRNQTLLQAVSLRRLTVLRRIVRSYQIA